MPNGPEIFPILPSVRENPTYWIRIKDRWDREMVELLADLARKQFEVDRLTRVVRAFNVVMAWVEEKADVEPQ